MLLSYSDFLAEGIINIKYVHVFYKKNDEPYRLYSVSDENHDFSSIKELDNLKSAHQKFTSTTKNLTCFWNDDPFDQAWTPFDLLRININQAIYTLVVNFRDDKTFFLYELPDNCYIEFTFDAVYDNNFKYCIADFDNSSDFITIYKHPEKTYPQLLKYIKILKLNSVPFEFKGEAQDFEKSNLYRSLSSGSKFNLFDSMSYANFNKINENARYGQIILFYKDKKPYRLYFSTNPFYDFRIDDKDLHDLEMDSKPFSSDSAFICINSEDREDENFNPFQFVFYHLDLAVQYFVTGFEKEHIPEVYELKDKEYIYLDFSEEELEHNNPIIYGTGNEISIRDKAEEIFPILLKEIKNLEHKPDIEFIKNAEGFEKTNLYKSLTTGSKYNLFESVEAFRYLVLLSHTDTSNDYITFTNDENIESIYIKDFVNIYIVELERPIKSREDIYVHISYVDDSIFISASFDDITVTTTFIEEYDVLMRNKIDNEVGLYPSEIIGEVCKLKASRLLISTTDFLKSTPESIIGKSTDSDLMYSFNDDIVFLSIDKTIHPDTIKNIVWKDPKFIENHPILKTVNTLKKYNI